MRSRSDLDSLSWLGLENLYLGMAGSDLLFEPLS
jgi:hypothetical protein